MWRTATSSIFTSSSLKPNTFDIRDQQPDRSESQRQKADHRCSPMLGPAIVAKLHFALAAAARLHHHLSQLSQFIAPRRHATTRYESAPARIPTDLHAEHVLGTNLVGADDGVIGRQPHPISHPEKFAGLTDICR